MLSFYRNYIAVKAADGNASLLSILANWDPKGMSKADLMAREQYLDQVGSSLVALRHKFDSETAALKPQIDQNNMNLAAADDLNTQVKAAAEGSPERASLQKSLDSLLDTIEQEQPAINQAKSDKTETESWLKEREEAYKEAVTALKGAQRSLDQAQQGLVRAGERRDREQDRTADARRLAGLSVSGTRLDTALNAMKAATEKANREADEARLKREALTPAKPTEDPNIAAALARASGQDMTPKSSSDRLDGLKKAAA